MLKTLPLFQSVTGECVAINRGDAFTLGLETASDVAASAASQEDSANVVASAMSDAGFGDVMSASAVSERGDTFLRLAPEFATLYEVRTAPLVVFHLRKSENCGGDGMCACVWIRSWASRSYPKRSC
jgi:hypothetical protein